MSKIINTKTWEILNDNEYIEVDDKIAKTISILNQKGYKTEYSCEGHINPLYHKAVFDIASLEYIKNNWKTYYIEDITERTFTVLWPKQYPNIYIKFKKDYKFKTLPEGFTKSPRYDDDLNDWSKTEFDTIEKIIDEYDGTKRKEDNIILQEIDKYHDILLKWAQSLPSINGK